MESCEQSNVTQTEVNKDQIDGNSNSEIEEVGGHSKTGKNRGKKRKLQATVQTRSTPRRAASLKKSTHYSEEEEVDDPDYAFSDSDNDPDFSPHEENEDDVSEKKGRSQCKFNSKGKSSIQNIPMSASKKPKFNIADLPPRNPKPSNMISDNTISSSEDVKSTSSKLSSGYKYVATRTRQNQAVRLPEGPTLPKEQLQLIESQFKSGDFIMAKADIDMMENPPIWRIDGKALLQKFQSFEKDDKILYRNISTYSGWTAASKALYVPVKVNFVFQSRYDTVVELCGFKGADKNNVENEEIVDKPVWLPKNKDFEIPPELGAHMPAFEIYLQTLISQALDSNFLQEIYDENDQYFVEKVKSIDALTEERKKRILSMVEWKENFRLSLDKWPNFNTMVAKVTSMCHACGEKRAVRLAQFYGVPYHPNTLKNIETSECDSADKDFNTCESCSTLSQLYNKVAHLKQELYQQCKTTVTNMRVAQPNKTTTNVLRDLLANDDWIKGLFRSMCTSFVKIDKYSQEKSSDEN